MTPTIRTSGNARPHIIAPGYRHTTRLSGSIMPLERPPGEPSLLAGVATVLAGFAVIAAAFNLIQWIML